MSKENFYPAFFISWRVHWPYLVVQVYELITCVRRANENARNLISGVQFLIIVIIRCTFSFLFNGRESITWPTNSCLQISLLLQIMIFCSCVTKTRSCVKMTDQFLKLSEWFDFFYRSIVLFRLSILFFQYRSCDDLLESIFFPSWTFSCSHAVFLMNTTKVQTS